MKLHVLNMLNWRARDSVLQAFMVITSATEKFPFIPAERHRPMTGWMTKEPEFT